MGKMMMILYLNLNLHLNLQDHLNLRKSLIQNKTMMIIQYLNNPMNQERVSLVKSIKMMESLQLMERLL
jgi:hypothetical protein